MKPKVFYPFIDDICFKYIFSKEEVLKDFLNSFFDYLKVDKRVVKVKSSSNVPIYGKQVNKKVFYGDILVWLNTGEIVSIEMYRKFGKREYRKSLSYITRIYSNQFERGSEYLDGKKVIGINLIENNYLKNNSFLVNRHGFVNCFNYGVLGVKDLEMYNVRLDLVWEKVYNLDKKFIRWLKLIKGGSVEEMKKIAMNDKEMEAAVKFMEEFLADEEIRNIYDKINDVEYYAKEEGLAEGKRQEKIKTAKTMLQDGLNINYISKYTGLSLSEIKALN